MNLHQLQYFEVLAKTQHYGKAADILHISQPSLSKAISLLEEELHVTLFEKDGRNIKITYAGEIYLEYVQHTLDALHAGNEAISNFSTVQETLSIGCIAPFLCDNPLSTYITNLIQPESNCKLSIKVSQSNTLISGIKQGKYDFIITSFSPYETSLQFIPIMERPYVVCMRKDDSLAQFDEISFTQLQERNIVLTTETFHSSAMQKMFSHYHFVPKINATSNEDFALIELVKANFGLLITSDHQHLHDKEIVVKPLKQNEFHRYIYLAYDKSKKPSHFANKIIQYAKNHALKEEGI